MSSSSSSSSCRSSSSSCRSSSSSCSSCRSSSSSCRSSSSSSKFDSDSTYYAVSVGTSVVDLVMANTKRQSLIITNTSTALSVYLGQTSAVTTSTGIELPAGASYQEDNSGSRMYLGPYFAIAGGTASVRVWERKDTR